MTMLVLTSFMAASVPSITRAYANANRVGFVEAASEKGKLNDDDTVTCRCHGCTFRLDGSIVKGPATAPQPSFEARTNEGKIEIRSPTRS